MKVNTKMAAKLTAVAIAGFGAAALLSGCGSTEQQKPVVETVKLDDGTTVSCVMMPDEYGELYEEMSCFAPTGQPTAKKDK